MLKMTIFTLSTLMNKCKLFVWQMCLYTLLDFGVTVPRQVYGLDWANMIV